MPGMMDTVLNLGLNPTTTEGLVKLTNNPRFVYDSYRRFIQMYSSVVLGLEHSDFEEIIEQVERSQGRRTRYRSRCRRPQEDRRSVQGTGQEEARQALPGRRQRPAVGRHRRRVQLLADPARQDLSPLEQDPRRLGHGRQRPDDGVRQPRRDQRHRRRLHPRSGDRREAALWRIS